MHSLWLYCVSARSCSYFYGSTFTYFIIKGHPFNECFHQGLYRFENWQLWSFVHVAAKIVALTESKTFGKKCNWEIIKRKVLDMASGNTDLHRVCFYSKLNKLLVIKEPHYNRKKDKTTVIWAFITSVAVV